MNAITKVNPTTNRSLANATLPDRPPQLVMSTELQRQSNHYSSGYDTPVTLRDEAAKLLKAAEPWLAPVDEDIVRLWLFPLLQAVRNPRPPEEVSGFLSALMLALGETPIARLTVETQREALRQFKFWPSVSDITDIVCGNFLGALVGNDDFQRDVFKLRTFIEDYDRRYSGDASTAP